MTQYIVMHGDARITEDGERARDVAWRQIGAPVEAHSSAQAIRTALAENSQDDARGLFVAVPERSFRPVERTIERKTVERLSRVEL